MVLKAAGLFKYVRTFSGHRASKGSRFKFWIPQIASTFFAKFNFKDGELFKTITQLTFTCSKSTIKTPFSSVFIVDFEQVNVSWVVYRNVNSKKLSTVSTKKYISHFLTFFSSNAARLTFLVQQSCKNDGYTCSRKNIIKGV